MPRKRSVNSPRQKAALDRDEIVRSTLDLIQDSGWRDLTPDMVAKACGVAVLPDIADRGDLFRAIVEWVDDQMVAGVGDFSADPSLDPLDQVKDRLFELFMARFDVMQGRRPAFVLLVEDTAGAVFYRGDACAARVTALPLLSAMDRVLQGAGMTVDGVSGKLKIFSIFVVYMMTLKVWVKDDSPDLSATMAELDRRLGQWVRLSGWMGV